MLEFDKEKHLPCIPSSLNADVILKEHQQEGVAWLQHLHSFAPTQIRGCILADDMGLGKTLQLLTFIGTYLESPPPSEQVYLLDSTINDKQSLEKRVVQVVKKIRDNDPKGSIAVLARYRYLLENAKLELQQEGQKLEDLKFWTFHGSKGLEADYCILIGFFQGKTGFPNQNKEEAIVEALLPSLDAFTHSEERRLLYVAMTRARKKCYIIADPRGPSEFINEMLSPKYQLHIASTSFEEKYRSIFKCPICTSGYFRLQHGKFGKFYSCSSGSICPSKPRICERCDSPSLDTRHKSICNNPNCRHDFMICDLCGRPMKLREGKFGQFWGCTGYGIKNDQCKHVRKFRLLT